MSIFKHLIHLILITRTNVEYDDFVVGDLFGLMKNWDEIGLFYSIHKTPYELSHKDSDGNEIVEEQLSTLYAIYSR